jgi:hypothetical protein
MKRVLIPMFLAVALWQIGCCNCDDNPTAPVAGAPTPAPSPTPTASPSPTGCNLPPVSPDTARACRPEPPPQFEDIVVRAQDEVRRTHPELFDGQGKVISALTYSGWVASVIRSYGYCAAAVGGDGTDEVGVKTSNDWNEQYDIVTGSRDTWTNYTVTCRPSLF